MAELFLLLYYFYCYHIVEGKKIKVTIYHSLLFSFFILLFIFGGYLFSVDAGVTLNIYVLLIGWGYFFLQFFLYSHLRVLGIRGAILHALSMCLISSLNLTPPLNPLILLYPFFSPLLPNSNFPILNLFILYALPAFIFCRTMPLKKITCVLLLSVLGFSFSGQVVRENKSLKIAVIQVGLYFKKGGSTSDFFSDMMSFLNKNPTVDIIAFSENSVFTYKDKFNENLSESLLDNIYSNNLNQKFHFFIGFKGFKKINNIVTAYINKNDLILNQKRVLIPFIEKKGLFNSQSELLSEYFYVYKNINNRDVIIDGKLFSTSVCYDSLFPVFFSGKDKITIVQSNYHLLNNGYGYARLLKIGGVLSKFSTGINSLLVINIQDEGGTVVIDNNWNFDDAIFEESLSKPFFIIEHRY